MAVKCVPESQLKSYFDFLHKTTYGVQIRYIEECSKRGGRPRYTDIIETRSFILDPNSRNEVRLNIKGEKEGGVANILIKSDKWEKATFYIDSYPIAEIHNIMGLNTFPITDDGFCVPFGGCRGMSVLLQGAPDTIAIEYDLVSFDFGRDYVCEFVYKTPVANPSRELAAQPTFQEIKFNCPYPFTKIVAKFKKRAEKVYARCIDDGKHVPFRRISDTEFVLDFGKTMINLEHYGHSAGLFILNMEPGNSVFYYAEAFHVIRAMSGIYGRAFGP